MHQSIFANGLFKTPNCLILLLGFMVFTACRPAEHASSPESYFENNQIWAFGTVGVSDLDMPGQIVVKKRPAVESVNTTAISGGEGYGVSTDGFELAGTVRALDPNGLGSRDVAYLDVDPRDPAKLLAYYYRISFEMRASAAYAYDVFALTRKESISYQNPHKIFLGTAVFPGGGDFAELNLADGLQLSLIADGIFAGQWALHYAKANKIVIQPWQGLCPRSVVQMPGQNPSQNPSQLAGCRAVPAKDDLCKGDPTQQGCRPDAPVQYPGVNTPMQGLPLAPGLTAVEEAEGQYLMAADTREAKLVFVSQTQAATGDAAKDAATCAAQFYAVARTLGREINTACILKPAPAESISARLTCGLTVGFESPSTYLERICDITAVFHGTGEAPQKVQVLKK